MLYVDVDTLRPQAEAEPNSSLPLLAPIKRGSTLTLDVQFVSQGAVVELSAGAAGILGFKPKGNHNASSYCAIGNSWKKTGTGTSAVYEFTVTFLTAPLNALFLIGDTAAADEVTFVDLVGEIKWTDANGTHETTDFPLRVLNDVNQGGESLPIVTGVGVATWLPDVTSLTGNIHLLGVPKSLDAVPTAGVFNARSLVIARIAGLSLITFDAGPADGSDATQVAPRDYDAVLNNFHWTQRL